MSDNQQAAEFNMTDLSSALSAEDRAGLVNVLKSKLNNLSGQHPDFLDTLSANVIQRIGVLKDLQVSSCFYCAAFVCLVSEIRTIYVNVVY
ncbi:nucleosome assembly protein 1;4-like protein [Tanacetum coccineum]